MWGTRRLAEGIDPKARSFRTSLAAGKSLAQKRDLGHPLFAFQGKETFGFPGRADILVYGCYRFCCQKASMAL